MSFHAMGLAPEIIKAVNAKNYHTPTPIQTRAIPIILKGEDVIGCAQTGTGKTAGFTLPILHSLRQGKNRSLRALVLVPTRELAAQVHSSIQTYGRYLHLKTAVVFGGVGYEPQTSALRKGIDILVATPGRLLDHVRQGHIRFEDLKILVIDEADRMLDMGFLPDIKTLLSAIPVQRQTLLFSATMPDEVRRLSSEISVQPHWIEIARQGTPARGIKQVLYPVEMSRKLDLLLYLIEQGQINQALVFTRTKRRADYLTQKLARKGRSVIALHSDKSQSARTKALEAFRTGRIQFLVATNIASRGLDVKGVSHVINYDIPEDPEDYVHRIGRTARADAHGDAVSLMSPGEVTNVRQIESFIDARIRRITLSEFQKAKLIPVSKHQRPNRSNIGNAVDRKATRKPVVEVRHPGKKMLKWA